MQHPDLSECDEVRNFLTMTDAEFDLLRKEKLVKDTSTLGIELQVVLSIEILVGPVFIPHVSLALFLWMDLSI